MKNSNQSKQLFFVALLLSVFVLASFTLVQKPWVVPAKYKAMKNPVKVDASSIAAGKTLYSKHCKACHGIKGAGDGPKSKSIDTKIRSFLSKDFKTQTDGEKYYKSIIGRDRMPNFEKKILDVEDRWAIINYIGSLK